MPAMKINNNTYQTQFNNNSKTVFDPENEQHVKKVYGSFVTLLKKESLEALVGKDIYALVGDDWLCFMGSQEDTRASALKAIQIKASNAQSAPLKYTLTILDTNETRPLFDIEGKYVSIEQSENPIYIFQETRDIGQVKVGGRKHKVHVGPRGGRYVIKAGKKVYL